MTVRVGVIGTGMIGQDHIRRLTGTVPGVQVVAVHDIDADRAAKVAAGLPGEVRAHPTADDLIADDAVDAVLVCSWGPAHAGQVLAAIAVGKPVFCEKPLATTQEDCLRIIEAEAAAGRRLVQVGYMRRYDEAYRAVKQAVDSGTLGAPLMMHCAHRNPGVPGHYRPEYTITDTAVHEFDVTRWLFGEEITAVTVLHGRRNRHGGEILDPMLVLLETEGGVLVDVEVSVNIRYGYEIRAEVVCEEGTAELGAPAPVTVRHGGAVARHVPADWRTRFAQAYDTELRAWIDALCGEGELGPSAWDGYAAAVVSDAALTALGTGTRTTVDLVAKPALYGSGG